MSGEKDTLRKERGTNDAAGDWDFLGAITFTQNAMLPATNLTVAAGELTITQGNHCIFGEGAAPDDLDTINGGLQNQILFLCAGDPAQDITLKHGTGNILTSGGGDVVIPDGGAVVSFYDGVNWRVAELNVPVNSVHGRSGIVIAAASDYDASQVDNDSTVTGVFVDDALDTLDTDKAAAAHGHAASVVTNESTVIGAFFDDALDQIDGDKSASGHAHAASVITNDSGVSGTNVDDALNTLDGGKAAASHNHAAADVVSGTLADARIAQSSIDQHAVTVPAASRIPMGDGSGQLDEDWFAAFAGDAGVGGTKGLTPAPLAGDTAANRSLGAGGGFVDPQSIVGTYRTIWFPAAAMTTEGGPNDPTFVASTIGSIEFGYYEFENNKDAYLQFAMIMPSPYTLVGFPLPSRQFKARFFWQSPIDAAGDAVWTIKCRKLLHTFDNMTDDFSLETEVTDATNGVNDINVALSPSTNYGDNAPFGPPANDGAWAVIKLRRDGKHVSDSITDVCRLFGVQLQILEDTTPNPLWT